MNEWKVILATALIFGAGVVTGGLLVNHVNHTQPASHHSASAPHKSQNLKPADLAPQPDILKNDFVQRLDNAVKLTPAQRGKIEKIIAAGQQQNQDLWKLVWPQFRSVMQDVHRQIRDELTPEQQKRFENLLKQFRLQRHSANSGHATNSPAAMKAAGK